MAVLFTTLLFLQEPGRNCQRAAEITFEFDLYLGIYQGAPRFHARLLGINRCSIDKEPFSAVELIAGFDDPESFLNRTITEFLREVEKQPETYLPLAKPLPAQSEPTILTNNGRPWIFET